MASFTSKATGNWDAEGATTWNEAGHPGDSDTVTIQNGHTVTLDSATECASLTVDVGGVLTDVTNNVGFTNYGATVVNGTFTCGTASIDLQDLTIGDGGLYENSTCLSEINGDLVVGGGTSGSYTVGTAGIILCNNVNKTVTINSGATLGSATTDYDITFYASMATSTGTFIAPNSSGNFTLRTGATWVEPTTFIHSNGEFHVVGSGTLTLGSNAEVYNVNIANFATLSTLTYDLTILGALDIGGGVSGTVAPTTGSIIVNGNTNIGAGGVLGANTAYTLDLNGSLVNSSGTLLAPNASGTFTFSGAAFYTPTTFTPNSGTVTFDKAGTTALSNAALQFYKIEVSAGATLDCNGMNLTVTNITTIAGTLNCGVSTCSFGSGVATTTYSLSTGVGGVFIGGSGTHTVGSFGGGTGSNVTYTSDVMTLDGENTSAGAVQVLSNAMTFDDGNGTIICTYTGDDTIFDMGAQTHYNLIINAAATTYTLRDSGTFANDLTITAGTFDTGVADLTITGNLSNAGTFTCNNSLVTLNGTTQTLTGSWTFWSFTKSVGTADTLTFDNTATYTFGGNVTLNGASGQLLSILSDSAGDAFDFVMSAGAVKTNLEYLSIKDSGASSSHVSQTPIAPTDSVDVSGNTDWFGSVVTKCSAIINYYY